MIDFSLAMAEVVDEAEGVSSGQEGRSNSAGAIKRRYSLSGYAQEKAVVSQASERATSEDDEVKHYDDDGKLRVALTIFGPAMFSDRFALFFLVVSVLAKVFTVLSFLRCSRRSSEIITLFISVLNIDLRAFRRRPRGCA